MALSGSTLPQVKSTLSGTWHVVTSDGFGSVKAVLDPTGTGKFSEGTQLETTTDVPGNNGEFTPRHPSDTPSTLTNTQRFLGDEPKDFQETESSNKKQKSTKSQRSVLRRWAEGAGLIQKRAHNINADFPMAFTIPAGTTCSGTIEGQSNVCLVKIANENDNGPFGGVVAIQMAGASNSTAKARSFRA